MRFPRTIYAIKHNVTNRVYVGSSKDPIERFEQHICRLRGGRHEVEDMQSDFDEYGDEFTLSILEPINGWSDRYKEYVWMKRLNSHIRGIGYNYKDHHRVIYERTDIEGTDRWRLMSLVAKLNDEQVIYSYHFLSKLFGIEINGGEDLKRMDVEVNEDE